MEQEKIERFLADPVMSLAVYNALLNSFLKPRKVDEVAFLAASRIAIDLLQDAWKELERMKKSSEKEKRDIKNIGI